MKSFHGVCLGIFLAFAIKIWAKEFQSGHWIKTDDADNLDVQIFQMIILEDIKKCIESCKTRKKCKFFNFDNRAKLCYLIQGNSTILPEKKLGFTFGNKTEWDMTGYEACGNCGDYNVCKKGGDGKYSRCLNSGCGPPEKKENTTLLGNMFSIGDKIKYECKKFYKSKKDVTLTSRCDENGTWTPVDIECVLEHDVYKSSEERFYKIIRQEQEWNAAKEECSSVGGHLIDITTEDEQKSIEYTLKRSNSNFYCYWTGGRRINDVFSWLDGTALNSSYTNWDTNEPSSTPGGEDCVNMYSCANGYRWNDLGCTRLCHVICELT
ncbi:uncharacterized protein LOC123533102 [Mercenaria mercenaria]|uniref:uncharacterized protein LOC123533102 n=1 Tax=Mercenaria mercenaria TaxID=6596 RepID=UPI00234E4CAF|nr:uncharacterized protein LOC123533102 [Mercenaria mercenaria]